MNDRHNPTYDTYDNTNPKASSDTDISSYVLEDDGDDTLYALEDSEPSSESEMNETAEDKEAWQGDTEEKTTKKSSWALLLKIMTTPVEGWKALKRARIPDDRLAAGLFYPVLALAALSEFTGLFYETDFSVQTGVVRGLITFITFFFSYFCVLLLSDLVIPRPCREKINTPFGKEYVMVNLTTLALFYVVFRIVPVMAPIFAFLPFWTIYLAVKGVKIFRVEDEYRTRVSMTMCTLILGCPIFWNWLFTELLPLENF